ncbi:histone chaperone [Rhodotorula sphaerocarpa]
MAQNMPTDPTRLGPEGYIAPTPQNTPAAHTLTGSMISRPQIPPTLGEEEEGVEGTIGNRDAAQGLGALAGNPAFAQLVQGRLSGLIGRSSGYVESLPSAIQYRMTALKGVQRDHSKLEAEFQREIFELEKRFADKYKPLYERRRALIEGKAEPSEDEIKKGVEVEEEEEDDDDEDSEDEEDEEEGAGAGGEKPKKARGVKPTDEELAEAPKGIPEFWLTALKNHLGLSELITERDEEALKHLVDIRVAYPADNRSGFTLVFEFGEGAKQFFENSQLEKSYFYQDEVGYEGDFVYDHAEGTEIKWKEGKDLTVKIETKKQRNKNTNQTRVVKKVVPTDSFFSFFNPPQPPKPDDDDDEASIASDLDEKLELDYQIGEDLKERVVPRAIDYFTGKALRYEHPGGGEFDSDEFDDEFDEDDEESDDETGGPRRAEVPPMGNTPGSSQDPQECKQQ